MYIHVGFTVGVESFSENHILHLGTDTVTVMSGDVSFLAGLEPWFPSKIWKIEVSWMWFSGFWVAKWPLSSCTLVAVQNELLASKNSNVCLHLFGTNVATRVACHKLILIIIFFPQLWISWKRRCKSWTCIAVCYCSKSAQSSCSAQAKKTIR